MHADPFLLLFGFLCFVAGSAFTTCVLAAAAILHGMVVRS